MQFYSSQKNTKNLSSGGAHFFIVGNSRSGTTLIARILKNSSFRKVLIEAQTQKEIYETIIQNDDDF